MKTAGGMKIGAKLGCGFGALLALMLGMGIFAAYEMGNVNAKSTEMADNWMPSIHFL
jgi:methyl-accepting chemotaxis protein